jgi:hypothetical protein
VQNISVVTHRGVARPSTVPVEAVDRSLVLLSEGRLGRARQAIADLPRDHDAVVLLDADARLRSFAITTNELVGLRRRFHRDGATGESRAWASALLAEHLAGKGDPTAYMVATAALAETPDDPLPPMAMAYARARLLRTAAAAWLALPADDGLATCERCCDEAVRLLLRYELGTEATVTCAVAAGLRAVLLEDDPEEGFARLVDARAGFADDDASLWPALLDYLLAAVALLIRDVANARVALTRLERAAPPGLPGAFPAQGRALLRLLCEGPTSGALAETRSAAESLRDDPRTRVNFQRHMAELLLDLERAEAHEFGAAAVAVPPAGPIERVEHQLLTARLRVAGGDVPPDDEILRLLGALADSGRARVAGHKALQLAHDTVRQGRSATAETLRRWGLARIPRPASRSPSESVAARSLGEPFPLLGPAAAARAPGSRATVAVRVLRPDLEVRAGERPVTLRPTEATLLVVMIDAHPSPLHVETAHEALWPDRPLRLRRLNTVVHRLRDALGTPDVVVRRGPLLLLDPDHCWTDLWELRQRFGDPPPERARALAAVRGNLVHAELPYVEYLIDARHRFAATWLAHAGGVGGAIGRTDLEAAAAALQLDPDVLATTFR